MRALILDVRGARASVAAVRALAAARDRVPAVVPYPDDGTLRRALDKLELGAAAERAGLTVPRTSAAEDGDGLRLPVIVKERVHAVHANGATPNPFAGE